MSKKGLALMLSVLILFTFSVPVTAATSNYTDVKTTDWYYGSLGAMSSNKIITGYPDGSFKGSDKLNIDQFLTMVCRLTDNDVGVASGYWAQNYIDFAKSEGWLDGLGFTTYNQPINRYETARITRKALGMEEDTYPPEYIDYDVYVSDFKVVPNRYKDDVLINYALGITRGYPDGSFQGYNTLTRAEGAVIAHRVFDEDVRKPALVPSKTDELMALMMLMPPPLMPLMGEMVMPGPIMMFPFPSLPAPIPLTDTPLDPNIAVISEEVLADTIIALGDEESGNDVSAGYNNGQFLINVASENNDTILIFGVQEGSQVISIDLLNMVDDSGLLKDDAEELLGLICENIDEENSASMLAFILNNFKDRYNIPEEGRDAQYGSTLMGISSLIHDHNVLKVTITTNQE